MEYINNTQEAVLIRNTDWVFYESMSRNGT